MPNTSRINGFRPVKHVNGSPYNGQANMYAFLAADGTAAFVGDAVALSGTATAGGVASVARAAAGAAILGVIVGFVPTKIDPVTGAMTAGSTSLDTPQYRAASTAQYVMVCDAPDVIYEVEQTTGGSAYTFLIADIGLNAEVYAGGSGSTSTGASAMSLDMATKATTATLQFKLLGAVQRPDNETVNSSSTAVKVYAKINNATLGNGTGATGQ